MNKPAENEKGQILPTVMLIAAVLAIAAYSLYYLFQQEAKHLVKSMDIERKYELASIGLEHARYKIQDGSYWYNVPCEGLEYDKEYEVPGMGYYTLYVTKGNLFIHDLTTTGGGGSGGGGGGGGSSTDTTRQGLDEYRTIGIKVKVQPAASSTHQEEHIYYAVVKRVGYGGPLLSRGKIDLPCTSDAVSGQKYNFYWGDIYSSNTTDGSVRIPVIPVARGSGGSDYEPWMPAVYSASNIYTAVAENGSNYTFDYTYDDMSPTAKCHPYSPFAKVPNISLNSYRQLAADQGNYYGPQYRSDGSSNPYFIDFDHEPQDVSPTGISAALQDPSSVFFLDTTDADPLTYNSGAGTWNTYCSTTYVSSNTLAIYESDDNQLFTVGTLIVMGPLVLKGDDPGSPGSDVPSGTGKLDPFDPYWPAKPGVKRPDNYYYPQDSDGAHYDFNANNWTRSYIDNIKHAGFLYVAGELQIGGTRCAAADAPCDNPYYEKETMLAENNYSLFGPSSSYATGKGGGGGGGSLDNSDICIYGTIYLDSNASLTINTTDDDPTLYVYYNYKSNSFAMLQQNVVVTSFKEMTYLVPTPNPVYPSSF